MSSSQEEEAMVVTFPQKRHPGSDNSSSRNWWWCLAGLLLAVLVLSCISIPASYSKTGKPFAMKWEPPPQIYTAAQATRAAKAAVAKLQQIEERRPLGASVVNPLALPKTKETDLSEERRRQRRLLTA